MGGSAYARVGSVLNESVRCVRTLARTAAGREVARAIAPCFIPEIARSLDRVDAHFLPPCGLVAGPVERPMMATANRDRELVTDLATEGAGLREANVMGVAGLTPAHEARLQRYEFPVLLVTIAPRLIERENALVDCGRGTRRLRAIDVLGCG